MKLFFLCVQTKQTATERATERSHFEQWQTFELKWLHRITLAKCSTQWQIVNTSIMRFTPSCWFTLQKHCHVHAAVRFCILSHIHTIQSMRCVRTVHVWKYRYCQCCLLQAHLTWEWTNCEFDVSSTRRWNFAFAMQNREFVRFWKMFVLPTVLTRWTREFPMFVWSMHSDHSVGWASIYQCSMDGIICFHTCVKILSENRAHFKSSLHWTYENGSDGIVNDTVCSILVF